MSPLLPAHAGWQRSKFFHPRYSWKLLYSTPTLGYRILCWKSFFLSIFRDVLPFSFQYHCWWHQCDPDTCFFVCDLCLLSGTLGSLLFISSVQKFHDDVPWYMFYFIHSAVHSAALFNLESSGKSHSMTLIISLSLSPFIQFSFFGNSFELNERWISWTVMLS